MKIIDNNDRLSVLDRLQLIINEIEKDGKFDQERIDRLYLMQDALEDGIGRTFDQQEFWLYKFFGSTVSWIYSNHSLSPSAKQQMIAELTKVYQDLTDDIDRAKSGILLKPDEPFQNF